MPTISQWRRLRNSLADRRALLPQASGDEARSHFETDWSAMPRIFAGRVRPGDLLVALGCGRGRTLQFWLSRHQDHEVVGVEPDAELAAATRVRFSDEPRCTVLTGDPVDDLPRAGTLFFLDHPLSTDRMDELRVQLASLPRNDRRPRLLVRPPERLDAFERPPAAWKVEHVDLGGRWVPFGELGVVTRTF